MEKSPASEEHAQASSKEPNERTTELPLELFPLIFRHLNEPYALKQTLSRVSRSCKTLFHLANPVLYRQTYFDTPHHFPHSPISAHKRVDSFFLDQLNTGKLSHVVQISLGSHISAELFTDFLSRAEKHCPNLQTIHLFNGPILSAAHLSFFDNNTSLIPKVTSIQIMPGYTAREALWMLVNVTQVGVCKWNPAHHGIDPASSSLWWDLSTRNGGTGHTVAVEQVICEEPLHLLSLYSFLGFSKRVADHVVVQGQLTHHIQGIESHWIERFNEGLGRLTDRFDVEIGEQRWRWLKEVGKMERFVRRADGTEAEVWEIC